MSRKKTDVGLCLTRLPQGCSESPASRTLRSVTLWVTWLGQGRIPSYVILVKCPHQTQICLMPEVHTYEAGLFNQSVQLRGRKYHIWVNGCCPLLAGPCSTWCHEVTLSLSYFSHYGAVSPATGNSCDLGYALCRLGSG